MSSFIKKFPAISQFVLAMIIGCGMITPIVIGIVPSDSMFLLIAAYSASLAGVILTTIVSGKKGLREMFGRLCIWRVGIGYWIFAFVAFALLYIVGLVIANIFNGLEIDFYLSQPIYMFIPLFIVKFFLDAGLGEELGWRGFLLPRMQARYNALVSSIIIGFFWGLWHLPLFMLKGMSPTYEMGVAWGVAPALLGYTIFVVIPYSILFTWLYNNTKGSLLLAFVFHASQAWFTLFMNPNNLIGPYLGFTAVLTVTAFIIVLINGPQNLSRKNERITIKDE